MKQQLSTALEEVPEQEKGGSGTGGVGEREIIGEWVCWNGNTSENTF